MGCITLVSDLGLQDASVASVKGILMQYAPGADIIDISHQVAPYHLQQAAYLLASSCFHFPAGSCHIVLCDIFPDRKPRMLLCDIQGHFFIAPDNGLLSLAFGNAIETVRLCPMPDGTGSLKDWMHLAATIAGKLQTQSATELGLEPADQKHAPTHWRPKPAGNTVECHVIHIDRYENVVLNITRDEFLAFGRNRPFRIEFARNENITEISNNYYDVREGEKLCRFNTAGYLEICINKGNAASLFHLELYHEKHLMYNVIKIYFS